MSQEENKGFCLFFDWIEDLDYHDGADAWKVIKALCNYYKDGISPIDAVEQKLKPTVSMMFHQIQRQQSISKARAIAGQKGGFATAKNSKDEAMAHQSPPTYTNTNTITNTDTNTITNTMCVSPLATSEEGAAKPQHTKKRFEKPSLEDIRAYCQERNNSVDPEKFFDFYESKGWMIGKNRMKDWKSAVRNWERKEQTEIPRQKKSDVKPDSELTEEDKEFAKWWAENLGGG